MPHAALQADDIRALRRKARLSVLDALERLGGEARRGDIFEAALASGAFTERELAEPPPPQAAEKHARRVDYELNWTLTNLKRDGLLENPRRSVWRLAGAAAEPEAPLAAPVTGSRLDELTAMPYRRYLRTPEWRETRAAALVRAGHCCALDSAHTDRLEVHHRDYRNLGRERPCDVIVLCHACHELHHAANGRPRRPDAPPPASFPPPAAPPASPAAPSPAAEDAQRPSLLRRLLSR